MASNSQLQELRRWLDENGGFLHARVRLAYNSRSGVHCRATCDIEAESRLCTVPHSLALSSLNALVDDVFPVFKKRGLAVEAIGYFFLMHEYIHRDKSFWKPYLDTLPGPDAEHSTPFWFDAEDVRYLEDTDVLHTAKSRRETHDQQYRDGIAMLEKSKIDISPYTRYAVRNTDEGDVADDLRALFLWAVTIFTSRSFSSQSLRSQDSKYWTSYKTGPHGQRQTVLLDMSRATADEVDFPVLFPVLDIPNHAPDAKVSWAFDPGQFSMTTKDAYSADAEVFNNYGPKRNDELLLGYGFCITDNPFEKVLVTLKPPSEQLQQNLRSVHPGYFDTNGAWSSEKATFAIGGPVSQDLDQDPEHVFNLLPEPFIELLVYMLHEERGLPFTFIERPLHYIMANDSPGRRYLPHLTRMIVQSLLPKLAKLHASTPAGPPQNMRQEQARVYRDGQVRILQLITQGLRNYLRSLLYPTESDPRGPIIVTIEGLLELLRLRGGAKHVTDFLNGMSASAGTAHMDQLREAGWEDDALVLLLCYFYSCCDMSGTTPEYTDRPELACETDELEQAQSALEIVHAASEAIPGSFWQDVRWTAPFIARLGGRLLKYESFVMMVPRADGEGDAKLVTYIHG